MPSTVGMAELKQVPRAQGRAEQGHQDTTQVELRPQARGRTSMTSPGRWNRR